MRPYHQNVHIYNECAFKNPVTGVVENTYFDRSLAAIIASSQLLTGAIPIRTRSEASKHLLYHTGGLSDYVKVFHFPMGESASIVYRYTGQLCHNVGPYGCGVDYPKMKRKNKAFRTELLRAVMSPKTMSTQRLVSLGLLN